MCHRSIQVILRGNCSVIDSTFYRQIAMKTVFMINYVTHVVLAYVQIIIGETRPRVSGNSA